MPDGGFVVEAGVTSISIALSLRRRNAVDLRKDTKNRSCRGRSGFHRFNPYNESSQWSRRNSYRRKAHNALLTRHHICLRNLDIFWPSLRGAKPPMHFPAYGHLRDYTRVYPPRRPGVGSPNTSPAWLSHHVEEHEIFTLPATPFGPLDEWASSGRMVSHPVKGYGSKRTE